VYIPCNGDTITTVDIDELPEFEKYLNPDGVENYYLIAEDLIDDGYTEMVRTIYGDLYMFVVEDGLLRRLQPNRVASSYYAGGSIVGDVIFTKLVCDNDEYRIIDIGDQDLRVSLGVTAKVLNVDCSFDLNPFTLLDGS
jgi:hypothetical protein